MDENVPRMTTPFSAPVEHQITQWRGLLRRRRGIDGPDVEELEGHLRAQMTVLTTAGLAGDEAFLVAVKRMGRLDASGSSSRVGLETAVVVGLAVSFATAAVFANVYPFVGGGSTQALTALHVPIALWLVVGFGYTGGRWFATGWLLTRLFTPLFTIVLLAFLATIAWTGSAINVKREVLISFDLLLALRRLQASLTGCSSCSS